MVHNHILQLSLCSINSHTNGLFGLRNHLILDEMIRHELILQNLVG
jgi:hypothetical protein